MSLLDEIRKALNSEKKSEFLDQILKEKDLHDALHGAGYTIIVDDPQARARQQPFGVLSTLQKISLVDLITEITTVKGIDLIAYIDFLSRIGTIDLITRLGQLDVVGVINSIKTLDTIQLIVEIGKITAFGEVGTWLPFYKTATGDVKAPDAGYKLKILSAFYYCRDDIYTELRFKTSGNLVLGLPTLGSIGMNPLSQTKPLGATDEVLELYMSAGGYAKGWLVYQQIMSAGGGTAHTKTVSEILGLSDSVTKEYAAGGGGSWVSPTGYSDPDSVWDDEPYTYDERLDYPAYQDAVPYDTWSSFIELTHAAISCSKIRYYSDEDVDRMDKVDLDVYYDGAWHHVYEGVHVANAWNEFNIPEGTKTVTKMRFRGHHSTIYGYPYEILLAEVDFWNVT